MLRHLNVSLTCRAPRVALLVPEPATVGPELVGDDWRQIATRAIETASCWWGGSSTLLVPVTPVGVPEIFKNLVRRYDPDVILAYRPTVEALHRSDTARFDVWAAHDAGLAEGLAAGLPVPYVPLAAEWANTVLQELHEFLSAPLLKTLDHHYVHSWSELPTPLTHISSLVAPSIVSLAWTGSKYDISQPAVDGVPNLGDRIAVLDMDALPHDLALMTNGRVGTLPTRPGAHGTREAPNGMPVQIWPVGPGDAAACWMLATGGDIDGRPSWGAALHGSPAARGRIGLSALARGVSRLVPALVCGDSLPDFLFVLGLQRTYGESFAAWLPSSARPLADDSPARQAITAWAHRTTGPRGLRVASLSLAAAEQEEIRAEIASLPGGLTTGSSVQNIGSAIPVRTASVADLSTLPSGRSFDAMPDVVDVQRIVPFDDAVSVETLTSVIPNLAKQVVGPLQWIAEGLVDDCRPWPKPAASVVASIAAIPGAILGEMAPHARAGRDGTSWPAIDDSAVVVSSLPIEHRLQRLRVVEPDLDILLPALAATANLSVELSNAGRLYLGARQMFGGLDELATALRDTATAAVLNAYLQRKSSPTAVGPWLASSQRRVLRLSDARRAVQLSGGDIGVDAMRDLLDRLSARSILQLGYVLKCGRCLDTSFYAMQQIGSGFTCGRCLTLQPLDAAAWCRVPPHQPALFHALDELIYQALDQGMAGPIGALRALKRTTSKGTFRYALSHSFSERGGAQSVGEIDFVALRDGVLSIGEAKLNGDLGSGKVAAQEATKLASLARRLGADEVIFYAPQRPGWDEHSKSAMFAAFPGDLRPPSYFPLSD